MTKNLGLLTKRRSELDNQVILSVKNSQNTRESTFIFNNNNHFINNKKPIDYTQSDKASNVVIFRKITSLRHKMNLNNNQLDKRQQQLLKNNLTSFAYFKNGEPKLSKVDQQQAETVSETEKEEEEIIEVPQIIVKPQPPPQTPHQSFTRESKSSKLKHDCLFCKYERVISSDKLPNFARKRINEIFEQLTNPEKYEKRREELKKSSNSKNLLNKSTRSHGSLYGSSSYLTTSQILDY